MRQLATLIAWIAPVAVVAPMALAQCGGDDSTQIINPDGGKQGSGSSSGGGSGSSSGGGSGSSSGSTNPGDGATTVTPEPDGSAPVGDGGADGSTTTTIPVPEGGAPSDPGSVVCNGAPCAVSGGSTCCYAKTDAGSSEVCNPPNTGCSTQTLACNEASDCNGGVCCQTIVGIALQGSTFCSAPTAKSCPGASAMYPGGTFQTCRTDGECGQNSDAGALKRCVPQQCTSPAVGMNATPNMLTIQACANPTTMTNDAGTLAFCKPL